MLRNAIFQSFCPNTSTQKHDLARSQNTITNVIDGSNTSPSMILQTPYLFVIPMTQSRTQFFIHPSHFLWSGREEKKNWTRQHSHTTDKFDAFCSLGHLEQWLTVDFYSICFGLELCWGGLWLSESLPYQVSIVDATFFLYAELYLFLLCFFFKSATSMLSPFAFEYWYFPIVNKL